MFVEGFTVVVVDWDDEIMNELWMAVFVVTTSDVSLFETCVPKQSGDLWKW